MKLSKKIFLLAALCFFVAIIYASYDISRRTTFPGSKSQLKERLKQQYKASDTLVVDSLKLIGK